MDRSLKWRTFGLIALVAFCVATLLPSFVSGYKPPAWITNSRMLRGMFAQKLSLGLDLQGGLHLVYSIDLDKAVDDKASELKRDIESKLADDNIGATVKTPSSPTGAVSVAVKDPANKSKVVEQIKSDYGDTVTDRDCGPKEDASAYCFRVSSGYADGIKKAALTNAVSTVRERIDEKGVAEPTVVEKDGQIIVELPGLDEDKINETKDIIARTAKLEFKVVDNNSKYMKDLYNHVGQVQEKGDDYGKATEPVAISKDIRAQEDTWTPDNGGNQVDYYLSAPDQEESVTVDEAKELNCWHKDMVANADGKVTCTLKGWQIIDRYVKTVSAADATLAIPDDHQLAYEEETRLKSSTPRWRSYYVDRAVKLAGSAIANATAGYDSTTNRPEVYIDFNRYGGRVFGDLTSKIVGKKLATILDGKVKSAPIINVAITQGRAQISMGGADAVQAEKEARDLVAVLKTGSLPAPLKEETASRVGPTLGQDAINKTRFSFILGVLLVIVIMVGVYKWSGFIAVGAVFIHLLMMLTVMALFGATITLPGIAALVLAVGMTVDGNILIYERIRDELLLGKSVRGAVDLGFSRAFSAILDGQLTLAAAGWVLLQYGSGPIKGFAIMLLVGIFTTLMTNVWITRLFFDWYIARKKGALATISI